VKGKEDYGTEGKNGIDGKFFGRFTFVAVFSVYSVIFLPLPAEQAAEF
jgi:hypothetical protein